MHPLFGSLCQCFEAHADPDNALAMQRYMKNRFPFLGIKTPLRRQLIRDCLHAQGQRSEADTDDIIAALWALPQREYHYTAIELLATTMRRRKPEVLARIEQLITENSWWDSVDTVASQLVAVYFKKYPEQILPVTQRWIDSGNMWLQRVCIIFQLSYKQQTDTALLFAYIARCADSPEFFLQKAIGWALRQYARTDAEAVRRFVAEQPLKPLSRREALKHL